MFVVIIMDYFVIFNNSSILCYCYFCFNLLLMCYFSIYVLFCYLCVIFDEQMFPMHG